MSDQLIDRWNFECNARNMTAYFAKLYARVNRVIRGLEVANGPRWYEQGGFVCDDFEIVTYSLTHEKDLHFMVGSRHFVIGCVFRLDPNDISFTIINNKPVEQNRISTRHDNDSIRPIFHDQWFPSFMFSSSNFTISGLVPGKAWIIYLFVKRDFPESDNMLLALCNPRGGATVIVKDRMCLTDADLDNVKLPAKITAVDYNLRRNDAVKRIREVCRSTIQRWKLKEIRAAIEAIPGGVEYERLLEAHRDANGAFKI